MLQLAMSITDVASALGVSRQTLHGILAEKKAVTVKMAPRLGKFLGTSPDLWINLQVNYDKQRIGPVRWTWTPSLSISRRRTVCGPDTPTPR